MKTATALWLVLVSGLALIEYALMDLGIMDATSQPPAEVALIIMAILAIALSIIARQVKKFLLDYAAQQRHICQKTRTRESPRLPNSRKVRYEQADIHP